MIVRARAGLPPLGWFSPPQYYHRRMRIRLAELADAEAVLADAEINLALGVFDVARTRAVFGRTVAEAI